MRWDTAAGESLGCPLIAAPRSKSSGTPPRKVWVGKVMPGPRVIDGADPVLRGAAAFDIVGEFLRKLRLTNRSRGALHIVRDADELGRVGGRG